MKVFLISIAFLMGPCLWGQVAGTIESGWRTGHLYERLVRSELVVRARTVDWTPVMFRNIPKPVLQPDGGYLSPDLKDVNGGAVTKVEFLEPICRQRDFEIPGAPKDLQSSPVYVFSPAGARQSDLFPGMDRGRESLFKGREYLLFLVRHPRQKALLEKYQLDEDKTYYRVYEGYLGAQELDVTYSAGERRLGDRLLNAVEGLCGAVRAADPKEKLARLRTLLENAEPDWRESVTQAIAGVEAALRQ